METCGVSDTCDILEFAAILDDLADIKPIDQLPVFHTYFIKEVYTGEPTALAMHKEIFERIAERDIKKYKFMSATKLGNQFKRFLVANGYEEKHDKVVITVAGKNFGSFDLQFLKNKTDFLTHINVRSRIIDPAILYIDGNDNALPGMYECKKRCGIKGDVKHNAVSDATDIILLIRHKLSNIQWSKNDNKKDA